MGQRVWIKPLREEMVLHPGCREMSQAAGQRGYVSGACLSSREPHGGPRQQPPGDAVRFPREMIAGDM